ncbi:MAG: YidC/Oxa1 family membrane protein insertase [Clostridia bacterium]|nr:YidC/Oxa1 family membrane protein insertase [Clostridia bacterium]
MELTIIQFAQPEASAIANIILWLVKSTSVIAGIILFTLALKVITLPFDYMSKRSMRKNSLLMEEMRPDLEKLQKQYADNKQLYQQKMMALYKKNGYSMFGSCLPTILTLVIFIIALNGFSAYSRYQNKEYIYHMSNSFNSIVYDGFEADGEYIIEDENGKITIKNEKFFNADVSSPIQIKNDKGEDIYKIYFTDTLYSEGVDSKGEVRNNASNDYLENKIKVGQNRTLTVWTEGGYVKYQNDYILMNALKDGKVDRRFENIPSYHLIDENVNFKLNIKGIDYTYEEYVANVNKDATKFNFVNEAQKTASADTFRAENPKFLWVKNVWVSDSPLKHPVETSWEKFAKTNQYGGADMTNEYAQLIDHLDKEKSQVNGYFILVVLTAGVSLLTQIIMNKTQKAQMELQTVDGQGAQTGKMMKWMMPIMMAVFAFMYTAAFSIYIILSSLISLGSTFAINYIVDRKYKKKKGDDTTIRGRIHVEEEPTEEKKEEKKPEKKNKNDKFAHEKGGDFLSDNKSSKSHIRGRLK